MENTITTPNTVPPVAPTKAPVESASLSGSAIPAKPNARPDFRDNRSRPPRRGGAREFKERVKPEFDTKIINIRRVTRVASGGRCFSFSVAVVSGDKKGRVGVGLGKAGDTSLAIDKATRNAKKHMIKVNVTKDFSIAHPVESKYSSARIMIMPAKGRGVIAGSALRNVIELAGIKDVNSKIYSGSKNKLNIARATVDALSQLQTKRLRATVATAKALAGSADVTK